jgi:hypothetical protein
MTVVCVTAALFAGFSLVTVPAFAGDDDDDLEKRVEALERKAALDRVQFTGDLRITADSIDATLAEHFDGLALQKGIVDTLFYYGATGSFPMGPGDVSNFIAGHYGDYLFFKDTLTFDKLKQMFGMFPPEAQGALMGMLLPGTYVPEQDWKNEIMYTTRMRLNMRAKVMDDISFTGRLTMYKTWGDSTGVQVFNGSPNSFTLDGSNAGVPNSDILRVDRAYFDWRNIGGSKWYLSVGRRPSTNGPPLEMRDAELRQGTPLGHVVNYQFDGITLGRSLDWLPGNTFRFCYGVGFESGFGNAEQLTAPADRLNDVHMGGINWDIYNTDEMLIQATVMGAFGVTDGFNGLIVLPADPVTGDAVPAPIVMRYTPSANLGDIYLADLLIERNEPGFSWFFSGAYMQSKADGVTTPFGGLFSDPFEAPEDQDGWSVYAGVRVPVASSSYLGLEYNQGSEYWFNFTQGADDIVASKLATRGSAYEAYWIKEFKIGLGRARTNLRLGAIYYDYEYSGSGWHVGRPKQLDEMPILAFPTYSKALDVRLSLFMKF